MSTTRFAKCLILRQDLKHCTILEKRFENKEGCITSIDHYSHKTPQQNKVAMYSGPFTRYFNIVHSTFNAQDTQYGMLTFNDITKQQYQTIKLENYLQTFQDISSDSKKQILEIWKPRAYDGFEILMNKF